MCDKAAVDQAFEFGMNIPDNLVAYFIRNHANGDSWQNILVVCNGSEQARELKAKGNWTIVANEQRAGVEDLQTVNDEIHVEPYSLVIAHAEGACHFD